MIKRQFRYYWYVLTHPIQAVMWIITRRLNNPVNCKHCGPGDCGRCKRSLTTGINCCWY